MSVEANVPFFVILLNPVRTSVFVCDQFRRSLRMPMLAASASLVILCEFEPTLPCRWYISSHPNWSDEPNWDWSYKQQNV